MQCRLSVHSSPIICEGNCCAEKLANHGPGSANVLWWNSLVPSFIREDFFRDNFGRLFDNFPWVSCFVFLFFVLAFF